MTLDNLMKGENLTDGVLYWFVYLRIIFFLPLSVVYVSLSKTNVAIDCTLKKMFYPMTFNVIYAKLI